MIGDILIQMLGPIWPYVIGFATFVAGAFGIYLKGRKDHASRDRQNKAKADAEAHERMNDAPDGRTMSDAERREWLSRFGDRHGD